MMTTTIKALMNHVAPTTAPVIKCNDKVTVIGAGPVGAAVAFTLLAQKITSELILIDDDESLARAEMLDIQHATMYLGSPMISSTSEYDRSSNSKICIVTAGVGRSADAKKEDIVAENTATFRNIIPQIVQYSPECILLILTYPVDIMTYVAWKLSKFPPYKVIGSGTIQESARFKYLLSQRLGVAAENCQAYVIGEQGHNSIPVWSGVSMSGVRIRDINIKLGSEEDPEDWQELHRQVVDSENEVNNLKGCGSWGIALSASRIVKAILQDTKECLPVSTHIKGCRHGVDKDVFLSLPCILGATGITHTVRQSLNEREKEMLQSSADRMHEIQKEIKLE